MTLVPCTTDRPIIDPQSGGRETIAIGQCHRPRAAGGGRTRPSCGWSGGGDGSRSAPGVTAGWCKGGGDGSTLREWSQVMVMPGRGWEQSWEMVVGYGAKQGFRTGEHLVV